MKVLLNACNWFIGIFALFIGLFVLTSIPMLGLLMLLLGIVLLPITSELLYNKAGIDFTGYLKGMVASALLITAGIVSTIQKEKLDHAASEMGGFPDISQYRVAHSEGIETYEEYKAYVAAQKKALAEKKQAERDKLCRQDLSCWADKHITDASQYCRARLEMIKSGYQWTDDTDIGLFSLHRWHDRKKATLTFVGDKLQFQDPSGTWIDMVYECDYDPTSEKVLHVRTRSGKLPNRLSRK